MLKLDICKSLLVTALITLSLGVAALWDGHAGAPNPPAGSTVIKAPKIGGTLTATYERGTSLATAVIQSSCKGNDFIVGPRSAVITEAQFNALTSQAGLEDLFLGFGLAPAGCFTAAGGEGLDLDTVLKLSTRSSAEGELVVAEIVMLGVI